MLQHLLRRLVFDVPLLSEYCKMPLKVNSVHTSHDYVTEIVFIYSDRRRVFFTASQLFPSIIL